MSKITARAWADPEYKARLMKDPAGVFSEEGFPLTGRKVHVHENTATEFHFVIPPKPQDVKEPKPAQHPGIAMYTMHEVDL
jgi:hypothetical protein